MCAVTYYSCIISWAVYYLGASFASPLPWAVRECSKLKDPDNQAACFADPKRALPLPTSDSYFDNAVLKTNHSSLESGVARTISGPLYGSTSSSSFRLFGLILLCAHVEPMATCTCTSTSVHASSLLLRHDTPVRDSHLDVREYLASPS